MNCSNGLDRAWRYTVAVGLFLLAYAVLVIPYFVLRALFIVADVLVDLIERLLIGVGELGTAIIHGHRPTPPQP